MNPARPSKGEPGFRVPPGQRQLFLDDTGVAGIENLARTMHRPSKKGAVIRPDPSLGIPSIQIRMAPIWCPEKEIWQIWDCAGEPVELEGTGCCFSAYYESEDGLHWSKPDIGLIEYRGSKANNFVPVILGGRYHRAECIVRDHLDPDPSRRYKTVTPNVFDTGGGGTAVSAEGIHWRDVSHPGISSSDEWNLALDEAEQLFLHYIKRRGSHGRAVWLTTSRDFSHWSEPELIFEADDLDQTLGARRIETRLADATYQPLLGNDPTVYNVDVYHMCPFRYESVYLGLPAMYHAVCPGYRNVNTDGFHVVELACSRDLKTWTRLGSREAFIEPSRLGSGAYDLTQIMSPAGAVIRGDELWFYYSGLKYRGLMGLPGEERPHLDPDASAICLAVLRRDGFISLDADRDGGSLLTEGFALAAPRLFVNVDARGGECRVEALDGGGNPAARSAPIGDDRPCCEVEWEQGGVEHLLGKEVRLRFTMHGAKLYSYWLEAGSPRE